MKDIAYQSAVKDYSGPANKKPKQKRVFSRPRKYPG